MTGLGGTWLVAERELREAFRRKSYWIVAAVLLLGSSAAMILPGLLGDDEPDSYTVSVVGGTPELSTALADLGVALDAEIEVTASPDRAAATLAVQEGDADVAAIAGPEPVLVVDSDGNERLVGAVQQVVALEGVTTRLEGLGLTGAEARQAISVPAPPIERLGEPSDERRAASAIVATVLYILVLTLVIQVANGTAIEKSNRISEVLLAIVRPGALLFGKVLGVGIVGMVTLSCAILPVVVNLALGGGLPAGLGSALSGGAAWFVLGLALYLTIGAALGALVERQEEAGSVVTPLTVTLIGSFIVAQSAPDSPLARVLAYVPLTSPLVMPARLAMGVASSAEIAISLLLCLAAVVVVARIGATVYRRAIVRTGRRLKLREVLRPA